MFVSVVNLPPTEYHPSFPDCSIYDIEKSPLIKENISPLDHDIPLEKFDLLLLPNEILVQILLTAGFKTLCSISSTCHYMKNLVSSLWKHYTRYHLQNIHIDVEVVAKIHSYDHIVFGTWGDSVFIEFKTFSEAMDHLGVVKVSIDGHAVHYPRKDVCIRNHEISDNCETCKLLDKRIICKSLFVLDEARNNGKWLDGITWTHSANTRSIRISAVQLRERSHGSKANCYIVGASVGNEKVSPRQVSFLTRLLKADSE